MEGLGILASSECAVPDGRSILYDDQLPVGCSDGMGAPRSLHHRVVVVLLVLVHV